MTERLKRRVAINLRYARRQAGMDIPQASAALGVGARQLKRYESVRSPDESSSCWPTIEVIVRMTKVYGVRITDLVPDPCEGWRFEGPDLARIAAQ